MCGRFVLASKEMIKRRYNFEIEPSYNIAPGSNVLILDNNLILKKINGVSHQNGQKNLIL